MPRARVFVLREKQMEVLPKIEPVFTRWLDSEDTEDRNSRLERARDELYALFKSIEFSEAELDIHISESKYGLAALIARKLLDKDVPDTKPEWFAPWND